MNNAKTIVFRVDASVNIGIGHVMRCLTLADILSSQGAECHFLTRNWDGNITEFISVRGYHLHLLPRPTGCASKKKHNNVNWLGVSVEQDIGDCWPILSQLRAQWCVIDHYAIDYAWEKQIRPLVGRILVLDDLADRQHDTDLLVDQNIGWDGDDYCNLVPRSCTRLLGPQAALIRPEFQKMRDMPRADARPKPLQAVVSMGGTDAENITQSVLGVILEHPTAKNHHIKVVMGKTAPWAAQIEAFVAKLPNISLCIDERDMAQLLSKTDYVIGAAGVSAYERFAMSIPTILSTVAENQIKGARAMSETGAVEFIGDAHDPLWSSKLNVGLDKIHQSRFRQLMSTQARQVCDGLGAYRVVANLRSEDVFLRPVRIEDAEHIFEWRYANAAQKYYRSREKPSFDQHVLWLTSVLQNTNHHLFIAEYRGRPVSHLKASFVSKAQKTGRVGICTAPGEQGKGYGLKSLLVLHDFLRLIGSLSLIAEVHQENVSSLKLFENAGYRSISQSDHFSTYKCELA